MDKKWKLANTQMTLHLFLTVRVSPAQLPLVQILNLLSEISGFRLTTNRETEALTIGIGNEENLNPEKSFKWVKDKVGALGISLSTNPETTIEANYSEEL